MKKKLSPGKKSLACVIRKNVSAHSVTHHRNPFINEKCDAHSFSACFYLSNTDFAEILSFATLKVRHSPTSFTE
jgi:hypothetical protein